MTTIRTIVQAEVSATVVANLRVGDVYKRIEKSPYSPESKLIFGYVTDIIANGDDIAITTLEFASEYGTTEPVLKVFNGEAEISIFPASVEEFDIAHNEAISKQERLVRTAEDDLSHKQHILSRMRQVAVLAATPTAPRAAVEEAAAGEQS